MAETKDSTASGAGQKFGTFGGVFTPSTLTILGVIMFLRFGQVVGESGIGNAILIILCAKLITTLTAFSISAVATNVKVEGGGAYFLISRSLGVEFGGAIGVVFFLAQAISVAMYVIGFTEALVNVFPDLGMSSVLVGSLVNLAVFICVMIGAAWTVKLQFGILAVLALSLLSFFAGALPEASLEQAKQNWPSEFGPGQSFLVLFALFFPAVTGIMAGVNMSGDLKSPRRSIPRGTLAAILVTAVVYLVMGVLLGASASRETLKENPFVVSSLAQWPILITAGIFSATLSSALGSMMGAPRILQALARDQIFPSLTPLGKGSGRGDEPRRATVLAFLISQGAILAGDLNALAPIITMFFMVTYGTINWACFVESYSGNPSYRPAFKFSHWSSALAGAVGCFAVMLLLEPIWATVAIAAMIGLHQFIKRKRIKALWGDVGRGMAFERARRAMLALESSADHPKNWRPIILTLSSGALKRRELAEYGSWLTARRGVLSLGQVIIGDLEDRMEVHRSEEAKLRQFIAAEDLEAFPAVVVDESLTEGLKCLLQCHGIGGFRSNTVCMGWPLERDRVPDYGEMLRLIRVFDRSIVIVNCHDEAELRLLQIPPEGTIDIWWKGGKNGALMLSLAHLLKQNAAWRRREIRILRSVGEDVDPVKAKVPLEEMIERSRIEAVAEILPTDRPTEALRVHSQSAAVVMIGFDPPPEGEELKFHDNMESLSRGLQHVLLISSAGGVSLAV